MSLRTRYFLLGSGLIMALTLGTGLVAYYNGNLPLSASSIGPTELAYIPSDAMGVAYANVNEIMNSEFRQKLRQVTPTGEEKEKLQTELGLDIEHDIDTVVAGLSGDKLTLNGALVLVRGRFNTVQIEALATQHGARVEEYKGKRLILAPTSVTPTVPPVVDPEHKVVLKPFTGAVAFLESGLIAIGDETAIRRGIDAAASHEDVTKNTELMKLVAETANGANAWVVTRFDALSQDALPQEIRDRVAVQWLAVGAHVNGGLNGRVHAQAKDDQAGGQLRSMINGLIAAGQLVAGRDTRLDAMLQTLQVTGSGKEVSMSFVVPMELLDVINGAAGLENMLRKEPARQISK